MRNAIRSEVAGIEPLDQAEAEDLRRTLDWLDSGVEICRREKPAIPPQHLVSYFALVDNDHLLLVDHINAQLWLPNGGHVDPGEHPRTTVIREAKEELGIEAELLFEQPLFLTMTYTVGSTAGHIDVSLWYVLRGYRQQDLTFDLSEFTAARWFHRDAIPFERTDPNLRRFLAKLDRTGPR